MDTAVSCFRLLRAPVPPEAPRDILFECRPTLVELVYRVLLSGDEVMSLLSRVGALTKSIVDESRVQR